MAIYKPHGQKRPKKKKKRLSLRKRIKLLEEKVNQINKTY